MFGLEELSNSSLALVVGGILSGIVTGFMRSLIDFIFSLFTCTDTIDTRKHDSINASAFKRIEDHIIANRIWFQGSRVRYTSGEVGGDKNFKVTIPPGLVIFSNIEWFYFIPVIHLYWSNIEADRWGRWDRKSIIIKGIRWSTWNLKRFIEGEITQKDTPIEKWEAEHLKWEYAGRDEGGIWNKVRGRGGKVKKPWLLFTPDVMRLLEAVAAAVETWDREPFHPLFGGYTNCSFLLHGVYGVAKTAVVKYIACIYGLNICTITAKDFYPDRFEDLVNGLPDNSILLMDDVDLKVMDPETKGDSGDAGEKTAGQRSREARDMYSVFKTVTNGTGNFPKRCLVFLCCNDTEIPDGIRDRFSVFPMGLPSREWIEKLYLDIYPRLSPKSKDLARFSKAMDGLSPRVITDKIKRYAIEGKPKETIRAILNSLDHEEK